MSKSIILSRRFFGIYHSLVNHFYTRISYGKLKVIYLLSILRHFISWVIVLLWLQFSSKCYQSKLHHNCNIYSNIRRSQLCFQFKSKTDIKGSTWRKGKLIVFKSSKFAPTILEGKSFTRGATGSWTILCKLPFRNSRKL